MTKPTPEQLAALNVRIATLCGWRLEGSVGTEINGKFLADSGWPPGVKSREPLRRVPDYCGDLNAVHEAEKSTLTGSGEMWAIYIENLQTLAEEFDNATECAPAWQRCMALDRTLSPEPIL